jgi:hypothetical protein
MNLNIKTSAVSELTNCMELAVLERPPVLQILKNFQHFMESEGSSLHSQEPSIGPYPEHNNPVHTSPYSLSKIHLNIIHLPMFWSPQ